METGIVTAVNVGFWISILLEWFPGIAPKWHALGEAKKRIYVAVLVLVVNTALVAGSCTGLIDAVACPEGDWKATLATAFVTGVIAIISSQGTHMVAKRPE